MAFHIGYRNLLTDIGVTVAAASTAGYEIANAYDGVQYDWCK